MGGKKRNLKKKESREEEGSRRAADELSSARRLFPTQLHPDGIEVCVQVRVSVVQVSYCSLWGVLVERRKAGKRKKRKRKKNVFFPFHFLHSSPKPEQHLDHLVPAVEPRDLEGRETFAVPRGEGAVASGELVLFFLKVFFEGEGGEGGGKKK